MGKKMLIHIVVREAFGKLWVYPANEEAIELAKLMRRQTFTKDDMKSLQSQGYKIVVVPSPVYNLEDLLKAKNLK